MNDLAVKTVDFMGDGLLAARDEKGVIWTGVKWLCDGIGLSEGQVKAERKKIQEDMVLSRGGRNFILPTAGGNQEVLCLQLDYVPLWLAKISITPNMKENNPELVEKLVNYQLKAKDVLAAAFLPQAHTVKQLTITSRDITTMTVRKQYHVKVLANIRDCISELEEMGFNAGEFFILDSYVGQNNQENPQYLCTERGCEYYSGKLEPDARKVFIEEFTDRFERMRNVIEGKPVKKASKVVRMVEAEEKETAIRIFRNNNWGILLMDNEVYNMTPEEIDMISRFVPEMQKRGIDRVKKVLCAFMESISRGGKLEEIASWGVKEEEPPRALLPDKAAQKPKRTSSRDDDAPFITAEQAMSRYNMCRAGIMKAANEAGAVIRYGNRVRIEREKVDAYLVKEYSE